MLSAKPRPERLPHAQVATPEISSPAREACVDAAPLFVRYRTQCEETRPSAAAAQPRRGAARGRAAREAQARPKRDARQAAFMATMSRDLCAPLSAI